MPQSNKNVKFPFHANLAVKNACFIKLSFFYLTE